MRRINQSVQAHCAPAPASRLWQNLSPIHRLILSAVISILSVGALSADTHAAHAAHATTVGSTLPDATLYNANGKTQLSSLTKDQAAIIAVFRGGWCPYCTRHLQELESLQAELNQQGFQLIAIAPDTAENLAQAAEQFEISFPLLADTDFAFSNAAGLTFAVDDKTVKKYKGYGIPLLKEPQSQALSLPEPALIITAADGTIRYFHRNENFKQRMAPEDIRKIVAKLNWTRTTYSMKL